MPELEEGRISLSFMDLPHYRWAELGVPLYEASPA